MRESKERVINGKTYIVSQLGAVQGRKVLARVAQVMGPALGGLVNDSDKIDMIKAIAALSNAITDSQMDFFCDTFSPWTQVGEGGKVRILKDCFDEVYAGNYGEMLEWLVFCFEVNFSSFFSGLGDIGNLAPPVKAAPSNSGSPQASTGTSGAS